MADPIDYLALFGADPEAAQTQATALANAIRGRRAIGDIASVLGGPYQGAAQNFGGTANQMQQQLENAAQHRAQQELLREHYANEAARIKAQEDLWNRLAGAREVTAGAQMIKATTPPPPKALPKTTAAITPSETSLSPAALDIAARQALQTGKIGNYGMGAQGSAIKRQILNRAAELDPNSDFAKNAASYQANITSLNKQQVLLDLTKSWESTGKANLGVLRDISTQLVNVGSPFLNKPLRTIFQQTGDPIVTKFRAAHAAVVNEYAKILSGATSSAGITDAARREAEEMLPLSATPQQLAASADVLEMDAGNRLASLSKGVEETRARTSGQPEQSKTPAVDKEALRKKYGL